MTDAQYKAYQETCRSYDRPNFKGEDIFKGLFNTDDDGLITFLRPPNTSFTSLEAYLFVCSIFQHQQAELYKQNVDALVEKYEKKLAELEAKIEKKINAG